MLVARLISFAVLLTLAIALPAVAADVTFTGHVTYRERMALPPDAAITITLVHLPDQGRIAAAHATLGSKAGSPISFSLNVRSHVVASGGPFGLVAEITSRGQVIFRSGQPALVDVTEPAGNIIEVEFRPPPPHAPPQQVSLPIDTAKPLLDVLWIVTSIGGDPVLPETQVTFSIASDHRAGGNGGCNNYFTETSFDDPPLAFGPLAGTRMACGPAVMTQEQRFFAALRATAGYELEGDALKLVDAAGIPLVGLVRGP